MMAVRHAPHPGLRGRVVGHVIGHADVDQASTGMVLPASVAIQVVVKLEDSPHRPPQFVGGAHDAHVSISGACAPSYLQVVLAPLEAYTVLGVPLDGLGLGDEDLGDVVAGRGRVLAERLRDATTWADRFALLDAHLLRWAADGPEPAPEVAQAWALLVASGGTARIGDVARAVGWSNKHLTSRFRQQVGVNPKAAARVIRGERAIQALRSSTVAPDRLAVEVGYADQAHLCREVRRLTGATPVQVRDEVTSFEAAPPDDPSRGGHGPPPTGAAQRRLRSRKPMTRRSHSSGAVS
jgi:AraC-like DNA-binding protein